MDLLSADTETGGFYPSIHALLSIGACCGWSLETFEVYITVESQPGKIVDAQAAEKNGYTPEKWAALGAVDLATAIRRFADWLQARRDERKYAKVVCHHLAFDKGFLLEAERVTGIEMPGRYDWRCSLLKLAELMDDGLVARGSASLDRLKELSGWSQPRHAEHNGLQDSQIAMHGYAWLLSKAKEAERALSELAGSRLQRINDLDTGMGAALRAIYDLTEGSADGAPDASAHDRLANEVACLALPWRSNKKEGA